MVPTKALWLTGLSGAGKSTIAEALVAELRGRGTTVIHLDGDALRGGLCAGLGFTAEERAENVRRAAHVARLVADQGIVAVCSLISPLAAHRAAARAILGPAYVEVYVRCALEECVRRDPKGLYARALAGTIPHFTGIGAPYEPPESPESVLDTQTLGVEACVGRLTALLAEDA